jgi:heme oxygenase (biliverdin-IX-beta and delta-forming)
LAGIFYHVKGRNDPVTASRELDARVERVATVRSLLRHETSGAHRRLDEAVAPLDLARREDYGAFLAASAAALIPLETLLDEAGMEQVLHDWPLRRRSDALLADLSAFDARIPAVPIGLRAMSEAELFGAAYVLEGARLGAKLLLRQVRRAEDAAMEGHTRYLRHGDGLHLWPSFVSLLETAPAVRANMQTAVEGGLFAFSVFERAFRVTGREAFEEAAPCA